MCGSSQWAKFCRSPDWGEVLHWSIFFVAIPGLFLSFENSAKLVSGHDTCLTASHLLAQFISTKTAKKKSSLLPATLQLTWLWKNGLNSVPPYALSTKKCALTPILYCHPGQQAIGCPSDTLHNTQVGSSALLKVKQSVEMAREKCVSSRYFIVLILDSIYPQILCWSEPQATVTFRGSLHLGMARSMKSKSKNSRAAIGDKGNVWYERWDFKMAL